MTDRLYAEQRLNPGQRITSTNGQYFLVQQGDGNLVLYTNGNFPIWATGTDGNPGAWLIMQSDGNLVVYSSTGRALWASGTNGGGFARQLCGWAVPTLELPSTPHWADHTFATYEKNNIIWGCAKNPVIGW